MREFKTKEINLQEEETYSSRRQRKEKKKFPLLKIIIGPIIGLIIAGFFVYINYNNFKTKVLVPNDLIVKIEAGEIFSDLGQKIPELNTWQYQMYLKYNAPDFELGVGNYKIEGNSNIEGVLKGLQTPLTDDVNIVILEGWNIYDIDKCLSEPTYFLYERDGKEYTCMYKTESGEKIYTKESLINAGEYIAYVTNKEKIDALKQYFPFIENQDTFEGFLYPDTYKVDGLNFKINEFVIKQLETFETKVYNELLTNYDIETITDIVNLASIVEKEERNSAEKSTVAGILKKRLNADWMIGADITVCYPHELTSDECKMVISKYINEESLYNTRTMIGLPKTPIGNPSYETIEATINDKETDYWYYLHNVSTGQIYYARTNAEHEANKQYMY